MLALPRVGARGRWSRVPLRDRGRNALLAPTGADLERELLHGDNRSLRPAPISHARRLKGSAGVSFRAVRPLMSGSWLLLTGVAQEEILPRSLLACPAFGGGRRVAV